MNHKIGVHWIKTHGRPQDLDYVRQLQPPSIKLVAGDVPDVQWISDTFVAAPNALLLLRSHAMSEQKSDMAQSPIATGVRHAQEWRKHIDRRRLEATQRGLPFPPDTRLVVLGINEPEVWSHLQQTVDYTVAFLDECTQLGLCAGALNLSVGWPANTGSNTPPDWAPYAPVEAAIIRGKHCLILHEYHAQAGPHENWGWWCGRYEKCPWNVPIIIGECGMDVYVKDGGVDGQKRGWRAWVNAEQYAAQLRAYHEKVLTDKRIHSIQIYTSDYGAPWQTFDLIDVYPQLLAYAGEAVARPDNSRWTGYVTATAGLRVRTEANTFAQIITVLPYGAEVAVIGQQGDWLQLENGFVFAEHVSPTAPKPLLPQPTLPQLAESDFIRSISFVLRWEGGYANDPNDPGGETNFGISKRSYPNLDIRNLTREQAIAIYQRDYWQASGADQLPWPLNLVHFDSAVNTGTGQAQKFLKESGGDVTKYIASRLEFYTRIQGWRFYSAAWTRRVANLMKEAA